MNRVEKIAKELNSKIQHKIDIAVILGSGWSAIENVLIDKIIIPYKDIKGYPVCTVDGHKGNFIFGYLGKKYVCLLQGRFHLYEGYSLDDVTLPIAILNALLVKKIIITNACGSMNKDMRVGDIIAIRDHINFTGCNPLIKTEYKTKRSIFINADSFYDKKMINTFAHVCEELNIAPLSGIYIQDLGPSYETPAEVKMFKSFGADFVGMSTAIEVIMANYFEMQVLGLAFISNMCTGISKEKIEHNNLLKICADNEKKLCKVISKVIEKI